MRAMMLRFVEFLSEKKQEGHGLHVFDIDDTLFHTTAKVKVVDHEGNRVDNLSNSSYNTHKLPKGQKYDFSEFRDAAKFDDESKPNRRMLSKMKAIHNNSKKKDGSKVIIATARADFDDKDRFLNAFRKHGVDIDNIHVHRAGNMPGDESVAEKKAKVISQQIEKGGHKRATLYDDNEENLQHFLALSDKHPGVKLHAFHVQPDGSSKRYHG
jgi:hypothetical protein